VSPALLAFFIGSVFFLSTLLTALLRRYAFTRGLLDHPNIRSSHTETTPKGGGAGIVITLILAITILAVCGIMALDVFVVLAGGGAVVAMVGWWDDHGHVAVGIRLGLHALAAGWALWRLGGMSALNIGLASWDLGWVGHILALVALVWLINLYNFMDGIDGLAGAEAVFAATCSGLFLSLARVPGLALASWTLAGSVAGFLVWNWPPARVFMGDVGSGFLGFVFGVMLLVSVRQGSLPIWFWPILLGTFLVDATVTLLRRVIRGSRWYEAHRRHAYQHAARRWGHLRVTVGVSVLNMVWLAPLAWVAWRWPSASFGVMLAALAPLVAAAFHLRAGERSA